MSGSRPSNRTGATRCWRATNRALGAGRRITYVAAIDVSVVAELASECAPQVADVCSRIGHGTREPSDGSTLGLRPIQRSSLVQRCDKICRGVRPGIFPILSTIWSASIRGKAVGSYMDAITRGGGEGDGPTRDTLGRLFANGPRYLDVNNAASWDLHEATARVVATRAGCQSLRPGGSGAGAHNRAAGVAGGDAEVAQRVGVGGGGAEVGCGVRSATSAIRTWSGSGSARNESLQLERSIIIG
eukprot:9477717-Pyramimonas_sp.AAC.1